MGQTSVYLHIPFCTHRCGYCDFNTYAGQEDLIPAYVDALIKEIEYSAASAPEQPTLHTVFFGGGTPSLLPAEAIARILDAVRQNCDLLPDAEISLEANPGTLSAEYLAALRRAGVNRLSLGVQSADPSELRLLERGHDFGDVIRAVAWARQSGFDDLNLDLIFALPGQSLASWQRNLNLALELAPEHLSLYALSIEHGTPFRNYSEHGLIQVPDPDLAAEMYEWAAWRLAAEGFEQYEISNWARRDGAGRLLRCEHNLQYWRSLPYVGLGAGAHGWLDGQRTINTLAPNAYIQRMSNGSRPDYPRTPATVTAERVDERRAMGETMMMGLRLVDEGISGADFQRRFAHSLDEVYGPQIEQLSRRGLLELDADRLRLTPQARLLGNQVFMEFV